MAPAERLAAADIALNTPHGFLAYGDNPLLASLAGHPDNADGEIELFAIHLHKLADTYAC